MRTASMPLPSGLAGTPYVWVIVGLGCLLVSTPVTLQDGWLMWTTTKWLPRCPVHRRSTTNEGPRLLDSPFSMLQPFSRAQYSPS